MSIENNKDLNQLVQELSKKNPNPELVKTITKTLGIPYSDDLIILMSEVLVFLSQSKQNKNIMKDKGYE
jgi:hypothetical protein